MSISSVSSVSHAHGGAAVRKSAMQQRSTDFSTLSQALGSNNLSAAQSAFATLQKDAQSASATQGNSQTTAQTSALQQVKKDAQTLSTALNTGNLGAAQQAFATLKQDSSTAQQMRGHHLHHHAGVGLASAKGTGSTSSDLLATQAISSVGGTLNVTA